MHTHTLANKTKLVTSMKCHLILSYVLLTYIFESKLYKNYKIIYKNKSYFL